MESEKLISEIVDYCRKSGVAESTFGRFAVNDGKFVNRLREGGRVTTTTFERVRSYISANPPANGSAARGLRFDRAAAASSTAAPVARIGSAPHAERDFRFFDNRQKYLLFVNTCSEKAVVAQRVAMELANIHPRPPAVRLFDAGVGDGTVMTRVMRALEVRS